MIIISHRGFWIEKSEQNTIESFKRALDRNFGIETDLRDFNGKIVISHDIPNSNSLELDDLFNLYIKYRNPAPLALNIKSDGLFSLLFEKLSYYNIINYFVFDMSVPDMLHYKKLALNFYTRMSEIEIKPVLYNDAKGIWLDEFYNNWINKELLNELMYDNKNVCIVSPELHKRTYHLEWNLYKQCENKKIMICTDFPELADIFFNQ